MAFFEHKLGAWCREFDEPNAGLISDWDDDFVSRFMEDFVQTISPTVTPFFDEVREAFKLNNEREEQRCGK